MQRCLTCPLLNALCVLTACPAASHALAVRSYLTPDGICISRSYAAMLFLHGPPRCSHKVSHLQQTLLLTSHSTACVDAICCALHCPLLPAQTHAHACSHSPQNCRQLRNLLPRPKQKTHLQLRALLRPSSYSILPLLGPRQQQLRLGQMCWL